jgi:aryl-alcohol dehydrogenase-like predicted oxidoreductase
LQTTVPGTDIRTSRIGFGTASLHHLFSRKERLDLLYEAASAGITHFDTSPFYGLGLAESDLGLFVQGRRDKVTLTSKVGLYPYVTGARTATGTWALKAAGRIFPALSRPVEDWSQARARISLDRSLRRLGTDYLDFLLLHEPRMSLADNESLYHWLQTEQRSGRIRAFGIAGEAEKCAPFIEADHGLARVVQTADRLDGHSADFLLRSGRPLQITYGYLKSIIDGQPTQTIRAALGRNTEGVVLIATRNRIHLRQLARIANER